ncbi:hypothetical protein ACYX8G_14650 [Microbacterium saperdae]
MTVSDHRVTGVTQSPAMAFSAPGGSVGLDVTRWPFVQGSLSIPIKAGLFDALDPRTGPQRVTLSCGDVIAGTSRTFDLGVRGVSANMDDTLSVDLASDEALLEDYSYVEDVQPWMFPEVYLEGPTAYSLSQFALDRIGATLPVLPPWVEERRNQSTAPRPTVYAGSTWGAPGAFQTIPEAGWVGGTLTAATTPYIFSATSARAYAAGEKVTLSIRYRVTGANTGAAQHISVIPHVRSGNTYYRGQNVTRPMVLDQNEDVVVQWTTPVAIAAGQLDIAVVGSTANGAGLAAANAGFGMRATRALIEDGWTDGSFFDGDTVLTEFRRARWLGGANASASVIEAATDRALQPYWELTNRAVNPRFNTTTKGAAVSSGASALTGGVTYLGLKGLRWAFPGTGSTARVYVAGHDPAAGTMTAIPVDGGAGLPIIGDSPDDRYLYVHVNTASSATPARRTLFVQFRYKENPSVTRTEAVLNESTAAGWTPLQGVVKIPRGEYYLVVGVDTSSPAGGTVNGYATDVCIVEHFDTILPFNGSTPPTADYTHEWDGEPDDSTSTRYPRGEERLPDSLVWRAGVGGMSYLAPLLQSVGMRLVCDENRQWSLRGVDHAEPGSLALTYGDGMMDYDLSASLDDWCDAATVVYKWKSNGIEFTRVDRFELHTPPRRSVYREIEMTYPGAGRAENIVRRAQDAAGATSGTAVTQWPATPEQSVTMVTPAKTVTGRIGAVTFNLDTDEMTVAVRTEAAS